MPLVKIERLAYGGAGFGRLDGKACFVPYTAPGDLVDVRLTKSKSSYCDAVLETLVAPAASRVTPLCPYFGDCGGCNWQHVDYTEQCGQKESILADTLWRSARIEREKVKPIIASNEPFDYRQRIQVKVSFLKGRLSLGFHRRLSHSVVDIEDRCAIAAPSLNAVLPAIREIVNSFPDPATIQQVDLSAAADGAVAALFHYQSSSEKSLLSHLAGYECRHSTLNSVSIQFGKRGKFKHLWGSEKLHYSVPALNDRELSLHYRPDTFAQINRLQNRAIIKLLTDYCTQLTPKTVLDLFCGNGNFSLPLAAAVDRIVGFESVDKSISLAAENAAINGILNADYFCEDSAAGIEMLAARGERFDLVIMDPPRTGAEDVSRTVHKLQPSHVIYISCDPPTLGRDIALLQMSGFKTISVHPVDMFPQTYHLETVVLLKAD